LESQLSSTVTATPRLPVPAEHRGERAVTSALSLQVGFVTTFLLVVVVLPIAAVVWKSTGEGWSGFWEVVSSPQAVAAFKLTLITSTLAVLTTAVFGTIIAWVLVRDSFAGKSVVNAIIDLPFALPTIVAGLVIMALYGPRTPLDFSIGSYHFDANLTFTRGAIYVALLFVTLPFVVRAVQPVLIEFDRELEDAARSLGAGPFTTFRRVVLPVILPGILSGVAMAFARAVGEIGAIVLIAGNLPFKTEVASIHLFYRIEQDPAGSAAIAVVLLFISFTALMGIGAVRWYVTRHDRG
jgi:sulfate transport system permease protein